MNMECEIICYRTRTTAIKHILKYVLLLPECGKHNKSKELNLDSVINNRDPHQVYI